jgi:phage FluMu gp28-like protein
MVTSAERAVALHWRNYQKESFELTKRIRGKFWCRQSGKDFSGAFDQVLRGLSDKRKMDRSLFSVTQRQADFTFEKCATHARAMAKVMCPEAEEEFEANFGGKSFTFTRRVLTLPNGVRIKSMPGRDPDAVVGDSCHVYFTEFALFPNGGFEHWRRLTPMALNNGLDVDFVTTPRGKDTKAYELRQNKRGRYAISVVDIYRAVRDGLILYDEDGEPCSIEVFQEIYGDPIGWQTEYMVRECDDVTALLTWGQIEGAYEKYDAPLLDLRDDKGYDPRNENIFATRLRGLPGPLTAGWDVARNKHLSVFWVNEEVDGRQHLRLLVIFRRCSFNYQRQGVIEQAMNTIPNLRGCGDSTGLGMESNEELQRKYGVLRWRGVNFAGGRKLALASLLKTAYDDGRQAFPASMDFIAYDLHALQKEVKGDRTIIHETQNALDPDSHCDLAFANSLALEAASVELARPYVSVL